MRLLITGILKLAPISTFLMGLRIALIGSMKSVLTPASSRPIMPMATLSRIIIMMSGTEHSCSSLGRLSIHAGFSIMNTWQTHATGLRQMTASRMALTMSSRRAVTVFTSDSPMLLGHGGSQSAHAVGAGSPLSRAWRSM